MMVAREQRIALRVTNWAFGYPDSAGVEKIAPRREAVSFPEDPRISVTGIRCPSNN